MAKFEVEGTFSATVKAEDGKEIERIFQNENITNSRNVEFKIFEVNEFWESDANKKEGPVCSTDSCKCYGEPDKNCSYEAKSIFEEDEV